MKSIVIALSIACGLTLAIPAHAAAPITKLTEKVKLQGKRGPSLLRPGFKMGEYEGWTGAVVSGASLPIGIFEGNKAKTQLHVSAPGFGPLTIFCGGGESRWGLLWITFKRERLQYVCTFEGEGAGPDAGLVLARSKGTFLSRMQQPQRAGELRFGGRVYRLETKQVGDLPIGDGSTIGYIFSRDGQDVGAVDRNTISGGFTGYLPDKASGDRDASAVAALILMYLNDQAN